MDMTQKYLEAPKVGRIKLSEAIRECGYGSYFDVDDCLCGRAFYRLTREKLSGAPRKDLREVYREATARVFGVPNEIVQEAIFMCIKGYSPSKIAAYVASQGY
jgi:hypothetical protein